MTEINDGPWHVWIAALVLADCVALRKTKDPGNSTGVDEILGRNVGNHRH